MHIQQNCDHLLQEEEKDRLQKEKMGGAPYKSAWIHCRAHRGFSCSILLPSSLMQNYLHLERINYIWHWWTALNQSLTPSKGTCRWQGMYFPWPKGSLAKFLISARQLGKINTNVSQSEVPLFQICILSIHRQAKEDTWRRETQKLEKLVIPKFKMILCILCLLGKASKSFQGL